MFWDDRLDHHLIHDAPTPIYMGELPRDSHEIPAEVVINLCGSFPDGDTGGRTVLVLPMLDTLDEEAIPPRERIERFLEAVHVHAAQEATYWHCHAGINRSGFLLAAYLHRYRGFRISEAIDRLRNRRSEMVLCNNVFDRYLRTWYGDPDEQDIRPVTLEIYLRERKRRRERA